MTERELIYVKTVADVKSISQAAKLLFIAQPSLSQYIKRIEDSLGTPLFHRTPTGLTLTYAGERYYHMASQILKMYEDFELEISDINNLKTGRIQFGITSHMGSVLLPKVLPAFSRLCPCVDVQISEENSTRLEQLLTSGSLDFVVTHAPKDQLNPLISYEFLSKDPFLLVVAENHRSAAKLSCREKTASGLPTVDLHLLSEERFIMLPPNQRIRQVTNSILKKAGILHPSIYLTVKNFTTAHLLAAEGLGLTLLPRQYAGIASMDTPPIYFSIPDQYEAFWDLSIATLRDSFLSKADLIFIRLLRECFDSREYS